EVRVARGAAVLALFREQESEASGEASRPQRVGERTKRLVSGAQMQQGAVEIAASPQAIRDLVEQADPAQRVGGIQLRQRRTVIVERLARIIGCLAQITEFFQAARRRGRQSGVARESG